MMLHIKNARYVDDYKIEVWFNNGRKGTADLSESLTGEMFEPLREKSLFSRFHVDEELETIVWQNGADLAPEYIFFQAFKTEPELQNQFKEWGYTS